MERGEKTGGVILDGIPLAGMRLGDRLGGGTESDTPIFSFVSMLGEEIHAESEIEVQDRDTVALRSCGFNVAGFAVCPKGGPILADWNLSPLPIAGVGFHECSNKPTHFLVAFADSIKIDVGDTRSVVQSRFPYLIAQARWNNDRAAVS
ncbi:hypothetical protein KM043_014489 [Ampulex compressa]|nr:hypothetical protein KM043_014489 [Ampulex compressa]